VCGRSRHAHGHQFTPSTRVIAVRRSAVWMGPGGSPCPDPVVQVQHDGCQCSPTLKPYKDERWPTDDCRPSCVGQHTAEAPSLALLLLDDSLDKKCGSGGSGRGSSRENGCRAVLIKVETDTARAGGRTGAAAKRTPPYHPVNCCIKLPSSPLTAVRTYIHTYTYMKRIYMAPIKATVSKRLQLIEILCAEHCNARNRCANLGDRQVSETFCLFI